ncbi:HAD family hydrolase [Sphingobacterium bovistauri]|uniref:HAD family phosphatase n=1 Tax=Sphingobacterium bovistauri TaxID=2781959 RepID=A0ABS7Z289_9SPHI|nr:HAD family phosphatase [Sphingobacterium bovistauri]MCA5004305.1 HAD family phosphatase [Sphingobacterium bovistauri]
MKIPNVKAVLFDLDGTLIDSEYFYFSNWAPILAKEFGLDITFDDWIQDFAGHTLVRNVDFLKDKFGIETTQEFMWTTTRANYAKSDMTTIRLMPFAKETLDKLKAKGIRIALVTSSYSTTVNTVLGHHNLLDYFEFFVTRELVENPKPNPEPYLLATQKLGLDKDEVLAVEDTITGYTSASSAGLQCVAVTRHQSEINRLSTAKYLIQDLSILIDSID